MMAKKKSPQPDVVTMTDKDLSELQARIESGEMSADDASLVS